MKTNPEGRILIALFKDTYEVTESRTAAEKAVNLLVRRRITSNQFSALVSFVMSLGIDGFRRSRMLTLINTRSIDTMVRAADEFDKFIYEINDDGQRVLDPFLVRHREFEKALFLKPEIVAKRK